MKWEMVNLESVFCFCNGKATKYLNSGEYPVYGSNGVLGYCHEYLYTNAIIVGRVGACGTIFYCKNPFWASDNTMVLQIKDAFKSDIRFCKYMLEQMRLNLYASGSAQPLLTQTILSGLKCIQPPIETQRRIAGILSAYDDLIENNQKQIKLLEEAAQRLYKEWFIDLHFPGHEATPIINGIPEGWRYIELQDFAAIVMGQSPKSEYFNLSANGLPFHQGVGSYGFRFVRDQIFTTSLTKIANAGNILFSVRAPVGRLNITQNKIVIGRGLAALAQKYGYQSFLFYTLKEHFFKDNIIGNGSIFASISKDELASLQFLIPTDKLVKSFEDMASKYDAKIKSLDNQINLLTEARDRLLPKLMSGEILV